MISQSNIPFTTVYRLRNDETGELTFVITQDGLPVDITGRVYCVAMYQFETLTELVTLTGDELVIPAGYTDRFVVDFTEEQRDILSDATKYTGYVYEVHPISLKRDPRAWFAFHWLTKPANYVPGQPVEPAHIQLDYNTQTMAYVLMSVYLVASPAYTTKAQAHAATLVGGLPMFVTIAGLPYLKTVYGVALLATGPFETTD